MQLSLTAKLKLLKRIYSTLGSLIAILIFTVVAYSAFKDIDLIVLLNQIGLIGFIGNLLIGIVFYSFLGVLMRIVYKRHYKFSLSGQDTFLLPFMMHLWTYIIPVKGGLIFQTFYVKAKYHLDMSKGFSVGVLIFVASLLVTSIIGGSISLLVYDAPILQLLLAAMFGTLIFFVVAGRLASEPNTEKTGLLNIAIAFVKNVLIQFNRQTKDTGLLFKLIFATFISSMLHTVWFYQTAYILGYNPDPTGILLATLVLRIIVLVRILPGNLGIQEVMTGTVFLGAGLTIQEGLITAILIRFSSLILAATFGGIGTYNNLQLIGMKSFEQLYQKLNQKR